MINNKNNLKIKLFTHNDLDGVSVIPLAHLEFGIENVDHEICSYKNVNEKIEKFAIEYMNNEHFYDYIFVTDISVNRKNAELLNEIENFISGNNIKKTNVRLFDHHQNLEWLNDEYSWTKVKPEDEDGWKNCGTSLFFEFLKETSTHSFVENEFRNSFVNQVRVYDTWEWKDNKELNKEIATSSKKLSDCFKIVGADDFINIIYDQLLIECLNEKHKFFEIIEEWELLLKYKRREIDEYINFKLKDVQLIEMNVVPHVQFSFCFCDRKDCKAELADRILEKFQNVDVSILYFGNGFILNSRKDTIDVSKIAKVFGGGGHTEVAVFYNKETSIYIISNQFIITNFLKD